MIAALLLANWLTFWRDTNTHAATARGVKSFAQKKYGDAAASFAKADALAPTPARAFNLGTAEIAAGNGEAGSSTLEAAMRDPSLRADALFNRGNAALAANAFDYAIRDYADALRLRPSDAAAKRNLEIAQRRRAMQKKSGGDSGGGNSNQQQQQKAKPETREQESQPRNDANTEALLRSVQQQENEELQRMNRPARRKVHVGW
jgi:tetratricopeptide (TPR) repeat protein